ncbi:hypothetical protein [Streptomyces sp. NPDC048611]|uniref:hypothetical protein n=1 Tax=Streptomyces sp. NPDC048611 TaxID=3155635 RepID=UPI00343B8FD2
MPVSPYVTAQALFVDGGLMPLGTHDGGSRSRTAVTITAAPAMGRREHRSLLREALVHMAREFGYVDAEVDLL